MPTFNNNDSLDLSTTKIDDISTVGGAGQGAGSGNNGNTTGQGQQGAGQQGQQGQQGNGNGNSNGNPDTNLYEKIKNSHGVNISGITVGGKPYVIETLTYSPGFGNSLRIIMGKK